MRLFVACLLIPAVTLGQITPRNLLQQNCPPERLQKVLITQNEFHPFPTIPAQWRKTLPDSMIHVLIKKGEESLKAGFPNIPATITLDFSRNGNRTRYENITFPKRDQLWNLVLAESVEGKRRFMDAIVDGIWSICEESFWGASAHLFLQNEQRALPDVEHPVVDLFAAETAANLSLADYFLGQQLDEISPLIRRRIYYEINRRIFVPMQTAKYEWMGNGDLNAKLNNWAPWIMSNYLTAALLLEKDESKRVQYVTKAMQMTDQYINGIGEDGGCEEGPHYWTFGTGCVLDVLDLLHSASNGAINIYNERVIRSMGEYIYRTHISDNYYVNVADSHPDVFPEAVMVWRYGQQSNTGLLRAFGAWLFHRGANIINPTFHRSRALFDLASLKEVMTDQLVFHDIDFAWLSDVQLMIKRLANGLFIAAHGGNNGESHNHNDVGDFIVYASGDPVIIDVGSGTYTARTFSSHRYDLWFNASAYHNLPTINGKQQSDGKIYGATNVSLASNNSGLTMNLEKAYPSSAGINTWERSIKTANNSILVTDNMQAANPLTSLTQTFMTVCNIDISRPGRIIFTTTHGKKILLTYGKEWRVTTEPLPLTSEEDQGLKFTWHNQAITRVLLTLVSSPSKASFKYSISTLN